MADPEESNGQTAPRTRKYRWWWILGAGALVGVFFSAAFAVSLEATSSNAFCSSACHSMTTPYEEYKASPHYGNYLGIKAECKDCHIPEEFFPKVYRKAKAGVAETYKTILGTIDTPEKFEARRWELASRVWERMRADDSKNCRTCHDPEQWQIEQQGRFAQRKHQDRGENTCIDCHTGVAHKEPIEPTEESEAAN